MGILDAFYSSQRVPKKASKIGGVRDTDLDTELSWFERLANSLPDNTENVLDPVQEGISWLVPKVQAVAQAADAGAYRLKNAIDEAAAIENPTTLGEFAKKVAGTVATPLGPFTALVGRTPAEVALGIQKGDREKALQGNREWFKEMWGREPNAAEALAQEPMIGDLYAAGEEPGLKTTVSQIGLNLLGSPSNWLTLGTAAAKNLTPGFRLAKAAEDVALGAGKLPMGKAAGAAKILNQVMTSPYAGAAFVPDMAKAVEMSVEGAKQEWEKGDATTAAADLAVGGLMASFGFGAMKNLGGSLDSGMGRLKAQNAAATAQAQNASVSPTVALQPTISLQARDTIAQHIQGLTGAASDPQKATLLSDTHLKLADAWEADVQRAKSVGAEAVQGLFLKDSADIGALDAAKHFMAQHWGGQMAEGLSDIAYRVANRKRQEQLKQMAIHGDDLARQLWAEVGNQDFTSTLPEGTIGNLIERRAATILDEHPTWGTARTVREAADQVLGDASRLMLDGLDGKAPDWSESLSAKIQGQDPLAINAADVAKMADQETRTKKEALAIKRRLANPHVRDDVHESWDSVEDMLARVWAAEEPGRNVRDFYDARLSDPNGPSVAADQARAKDILGALSGQTREEVVDGFRRIAADDLELTSPEVAQALREAPIEAVVKKWDEQITPDMPKQPDEFGIHDAVERARKIADASWNQAAPMMDKPSDAARTLLEAHNVGPKMEMDSGPIADITELFSGAPVKAADLLAASKRAPGEALSKITSNFENEVRPRGNSLYRAIVEAPDLARSIYRWTNRKLFDLPTLKREAFAKAKEGDSAFYRSLIYSYKATKSLQDALMRFMGRATDVVDRYNPEIVRVTGPGIEAVNQRLGRSDVVATIQGKPYRYGDLFNAVLYGDFAAERWNLATNPETKAKVPAQRVKDITDFIKAAQDVREAAGQGVLDPSVLKQIEADAAELRDWSVRSTIDQLVSTGNLGEDDAARILGMNQSWAPWDAVDKILEAMDPEEYAKTLKGEGSMDPLRELFIDEGGDIESAAREARKERNPIWKRSQGISSSRKVMEPMRAIAHRVALTASVVNRQRMLNLLPDSHVLSLLPDGDPLKKASFTDRIAYAGDKDITVNIAGRQVELQANTEVARQLRKEGGATVAATYDGKTVPFYVDPEHARDLMSVSTKGAQAVSDSAQLVLGKWWEETVAPLIKVTGKTVEPAAKVFKGIVVGLPRFAYREALRNWVGAGVRSEMWKDVIPFRNMANGFAVHLMESMGVKADAKIIESLTSDVGFKGLPEMRANDIELARMIEHLGQGQSNIAGDLAPNSVSRIVNSVQGQLQPGPKGVFHRIFQNVGSLPKGAGSWEKTKAVTKDAFSVTGKLTDEPLRVDAGVYAARQVLESITPEMRLAEHEGANGKVYDRFVADGREREYWILRDRMKISTGVRDSNLDFLDRGTGHATANALEPFAGIGVIDFEANRRALARDPQKFLTKLGVLAILPAMVEGLHAANDEMDDERSVFQRLGWFKFPGTDVMIPRAQGYVGALSYAVREATKAAARTATEQEGPEAWSRMASQVMGGFVETTPFVNWGFRYDDKQAQTVFSSSRALSSVLPFGMDVLAEAMTDYDPQFDAKITPKYNAEARAQRQYRPGYLEMLKKLEMDPFKVDYFVSGITGGKSSPARPFYMTREANIRDEQAGMKNWFEWNPPKEPLGYRSISVGRVEKIFNQVYKEKETLSAYISNKNYDGALKYTSSRPYLKDALESMLAGDESGDGRVKWIVEDWRKSQKDRRDLLDALGNVKAEPDVLNEARYGVEFDMTRDAQRMLAILQQLPEFKPFFQEEK